MSKFIFTEYQIQLVAGWWVDKIKENTIPQSVVNAALNGMSPGMAAAVELKRAITPSADSLEAFHDTLCALLRDTEVPGAFSEDRRKPENWGVISTGYAELKMDYQPFGLLATACKRSKLSAMALPWKTTVHMGYEVATGCYNGEKEIIYDDYEY